MIHLTQEQIAWWGLALALVLLAASMFPPDGPPGVYT